MEGYTQLDYIQSDGRQWIDVGFSPADYESNLDITIEYQLTGASPSQNISPLFGAFDDDGAFYVCVQNVGPNGILFSDVMSTNFESESGADLQRHTLRLLCNFDEQKLYIDNVLIDADDQLLGGGATSNFHVFAMQTPFLEEQYVSKMNLYSLVIKDTVSGDTLREFIPVQNDQTNEIGLYDTVTNAFYHNLGQGSFRGPSGGVYDEVKPLEVTQYDLEIWDWKSGLYIADISHIVLDGINISWALNDIETLNFDIDLIQFEKKCAMMGVTPEEVLTPYVHDIRVRRNGEYILGAQVVETNIQINEQEPPAIQVKCTGFLNLFKDQYITNSWGGYTYAQIARKLVEGAQSSDSLLYNSTIDIDAAYWLAANGTISYSTSSPHSGTGCLAGTRSGTGWITYGTQMSVQPGQKVKIDLWVKGQSGVTSYIRERQLVTQSSNQSAIHQFTTNGSWQHIVINSYETVFEDGYLVIEHSRTDSSTPLCVDDVYVYLVNDDAALCNMNVRLGVDTASANQDHNRVRSYSLQNVKDAIMELTSLESDNFDFDFSPDRTFNVYSRKGQEKTDLELVYPGNIQSMDITRSASNMANKIINIGSGIGDQRLQVVQSNTTSRQIYGTRESVLTNNNVNMKQTLRTEAVGELWDRKDPTDLPSVVVRDGSINPSNLQVGDSVLVQVHGDSYLSTVNGMYRVVQMDVSTNLENVETVTLTLEPPLVRPTPKTIRYIKDSLYGSSANTSNHWVEIEALMLVGNEYFNVAYGKTVTCSTTGEGQNIQRITDGDLNSANYFGASRRSSVTIDLGAEYPIDYIKVWHYYADGRTYYGNVLSVGKTNKSGTTALDTVLWSYNDSSGYVETADGRQSRWLQEDV